MVRATSSNVLRRITTLLIICCLLTVGLCVNTAAALPGSGTQEDPWRIESLADFDEFAADPNYWDDYTRLETDVNLAGRTYSTTVIAPDTDSSTDLFQGTAFTGVFNGNEHKITGLTIDDAGAGNDYLGLFGYIGEDGQVSNLGIEGGSVSGNYLVGGLAGGNAGTISNCYSTGSASGTRFVGGLVGISSGTISNCYSSGSVGGDHEVGGLVGDNAGTITNCYSTDGVTGNDAVAGLVGFNYEKCSISNCYSTGTVSGSTYVGGLVGYNLDGPITKCYSTGTVSGSTYVGGLVGLNYAWIGRVTQCYSTGAVSGDSYVGGLVGENYLGAISNCCSTGSASGDSYVGGLVGENVQEERMFGTISNCYSSGTVSGDENVGGLVGYTGLGVGTSFWDVNTSAWPTSGGGTPKTTAEMQTKSTFTDAGWDFVEIWLINEGATYPVLRQEIRSDLNGTGGINLLDFAIFADHWLEGTGD